MVGSYAFVHKSSPYIGKIFTAGSTYTGYYFAKRHHQHYNSLRIFHNFPYFPTDIQKMVDNTDARYAHRWLKDDYMKIEVA
jgi:hypothetical protein